MDRPSILIIKLSSVGDIVMATPAVHQLKCHTNARIVWAIDEGIAPLLRGHPDVDELLLFPRDPFRFPTFDPFRVVPKAAHTVVKLRRDYFDAALDLQGRGRTYLLLQLARARIKIGRGSFPLLARAIPHNRHIQRHAVETNLEALEMLNVPVPERPALTLPAVAGDRKRVEGFLSELGIRRDFAVLLPGGTWPSKRWPARHWAELSQWLRMEKLDVVLAGSRAEAALGTRITSLLQDATGVFSAFGSLSLRELYHLLDLSLLVVSGDTGPLHIAAATRTPLVALYGPTDPLRTGPWPPGRAEVVTAPGCTQCRMPHCSRGCMKLLYPCAVTQAVMSIRSGAQQAIRA